MSVLASLAHAYGRMANRGAAPPFGYSTEKIGFLIPLKEDGTPSGSPIDLREGEGRRRSPRLMAVPASFKRPGVTPRAFFLWDNTAFALGVTAAEGKDGIARFAAFRTRHQKDLEGTNDPGLLALLRFVETWRPEQFDALGWPEEMKDQNVVFALESERRQRMIHGRPAARELWARYSSGGEHAEAVCLVTGERGPVARIHPAIKGIRSPGGGKDADSLVSFNASAFESYGHEQGDNAPVSDAAAFAYTTALNKFLERDSRHRIQIGDASTVFWADASDAQVAEAAEAVFGILLGIDEDAQANKVRPILEKIRAGRPIAEAAPQLAEGVRFCVLGLSPNSARLSVRFWLEDDFGIIAANLSAHLKDLSIEPNPFRAAPAAWALLYETAVHVPKEGLNGRVTWKRSKDAQPPPILAGDLMRAILTGSGYPRTLLSRIVQRVRAERGRVTGARAAICKAIINRAARLSQQKEDMPVALDRENANPAYRLGRLFALLERTQKLALPDLNATIRDRYFAGASAAPARVFPLLVKNGMHHASAAQKVEAKRSLAFWLENEMGEVWSGLEPELPRALRLEDQGRFQIGYFHQRFAKSDKSGTKNPVADDIPDIDSPDATEEPTT